MLLCKTVAHLKQTNPLRLRWIWSVS